MKLILSLAFDSKLGCRKMKLIVRTAMNLLSPHSAYYIDFCWCHPVKQHCIDVSSSNGVSTAIKDIAACICLSERYGHIIKVLGRSNHTCSNGHSSTMRCGYFIEVKEWLVLNESRGLQPSKDLVRSLRHLTRNRRDYLESTSNHNITEIHWFLQICNI